MTYLELLRLWERRRREYHCLDPNLVWFQRHNDDVVAEVSFVNHHYRWRVFDEKSYFDPRSEGWVDTLAEAKKVVFDEFENEIRSDPRYCSLRRSSV